MNDINDIKSKFSQLQNNVTQLNNKKIGMESEIKTIDSDLTELVDKILKVTGKGSIEEAVKYYQEQNTLLEQEKEEVSKELDEYLKSDKDDSNEISLD